MHKIMIFVDFWNFTLTMNRLTGMGFQTDWKVLPHVIARGAMHIVAPDRPYAFRGMHVYGSYDPNSAKDEDLTRWAWQTVGRFPGVYVNFIPRQAVRNPPNCPSCHANVEQCPKCGSSMLGTEEKSVDVNLATDLIRYAWEDAYDVAVLVTSDNDMLPCVEFLQQKGRILVHGAFPPQGAELSQKCWANIDLPKFRHEFRR